MNWVVAIAAFGVTLGIMPIVTRRLRRFDRLDVPNARSSHSQSVPRGGGYACLVGMAAGMLVVAPDWTWRWGPAVVAVVIAALVGAWDDARSLGPVPRLAAQVVAGCLLGAVIGWPWVAVGAVIAVAVINAVNFMDGINGITSLTVIVWGAFIALVGVREEVGAMVVLGGLAAGSALGFLPWNLPAGRVFLGDVGSYLFGAVLSAGTVVGLASGVTPGVVLAPLLPYFADTAYTLVTRAYRREAVLSAHRDHVYQRLVSVVGLSHAQVAVLVGLLAATMCALWMTLSVVPAASLTLLLLLAYVTSVRWWPVRHATRSRTGKAV